jgi:hypothetical protein
MKDYRSPYLAVADPRLAMRGAGAPRSTVFGALGIGGGAGQFIGGGAKSLGGLVKDTKSPGKHHADVVSDNHAFATEHGHYMKNHTEIPLRHYGQVSYNGAFYGKTGPILP